LIYHAQRTYDDSILKPYRFTKRLIRNHFADECEIFLVYGTPQGIGKSALVSHVLADVHGYLQCKDEELVRAMWVKPEEAYKMPKWESDWEAVKSRTFYPPDEVVDKCLYMLDHEIVDVAFHWDDAGTWLYAMEYHDPFVIAFMEYLGLARSNWKGGVILSTPFAEWVLKKLRTSEGILRVKVTKPPGDSLKYIWKPRIATCYKKERPFPGATRVYWPRQFTDKFIAIMPDTFFKWYKPRRDKYGKLAALKMRMAIRKRKARGWDVAEAEEYLEQLEKYVWEANYKAKELHEAVIAEQGKPRLER
jgi:hypothetical protein